VPHWQRLVLALPGARGQHVALCLVPLRLSALKAAHWPETAAAHARVRQIAKANEADLVVARVKGGAGRERALGEDGAAGGNGAQGNQVSEKVKRSN
jgi:hypothetical protein